MIGSKQEFLGVLRQYNPWWGGGRTPDLPKWRRAAFTEILAWIKSPPAGRALLLSGARQVGKTTLFLQAIDVLLDRGVPATNILYATLDHPLFKLSGLDALVQLWREFEPSREGPEYLFLDEVQQARDWQVWIKHQVDFEKRRQIAVTGSATPLVTEGQESGVGRWQTIRLSTMSFYEHLQLRRLQAGVAPIPDLPAVSSLRSLQDWKPTDLNRVASEARPLVVHFHEYLLRGGFPQCALIESIPLAQKLLREDIVDKVLKRDMTAIFGVRRVIELEQVFLYLCLHDGGLLDVPQLCQRLEAKRTTVLNYIDLLEATHLIHRLRPLGYGKQVLRSRPKVYLADPAIAPSVLLKGRSLLEDSDALARAVETAFFNHVCHRYWARSMGFSYWRGKRDREVDIVADIDGRLVPFEVKYRSPEHTRPGDLKGLSEFCEAKRVDVAYVITRELSDLRTESLPAGPERVRLVKVPAALACYWLGRAEFDTAQQPGE